MTRTLEFTLPELLKRLETGQIPMSAHVKVTYEDAAPQKDPTLALFDQWAKEDAVLTPEQRADNERIYSHIEQNGIPRMCIEDN